MNGAVIELNKQTANHERFGATFYSSGRSLRGLLIGPTLCTGCSQSVNNPGKVVAAWEIENLRTT
jgi:hypothetical protein